MHDVRTRPPRTILTRRRFFALVTIAVAMGALALFVADNYVIVGIRPMNMRVEMRLAWALLLSLLVGGTIGFLIARRRYARRRPPAA